MKGVVTDCGKCKLVVVVVASVAEGSNQRKSNTEAKVPKA